MKRNTSCPSPLAREILMAYWLGELDADSEARTEEHYLGCAQCAHRLEQLVALGQGIRALARSSGVNVVIDEAFVRRLTEGGLRVREYQVPLNGSVNCTVMPEDDYVVSRLEAPLNGVTRLDMVHIYPGNMGSVRHEDIPFVTESGSVIFSMNMDILRSLPAVQLRVQLLAIDNNDERTVGEYTFNHTPGA